VKASDVLGVVMLVAAVLVIYVLPLVVCGLKGKPGVILAGVFFHPCWWVGAIRLGKPGSWWARRYYGPAKRARADERFGAPVVDDHAAWTDDDKDAWTGKPDPSGTGQRS
jgi:hypothetical protein